MLFPLLFFPSMYVVESSNHVSCAVVPVSAMNKNILLRKFLKREKLHDLEEEEEEE